MFSPDLRPIKGGWAALGPDWAVFGESKEEAVRRYGEAERLHKEIQSRLEPRSEVLSTPGGKAGGAVS